MNERFRKRWKISSGEMPLSDFVIEFDGGTSCNIPRKGFGVGYGSFQINDLEIQRLQFDTGYSANAAEIETMYKSLIALDKYIREDIVTHVAPSILVCGDSCIALKWLNCNRNPVGSDKFVTIINEMKTFIYNRQESFVFGEITPFWRPRKKSVELFGH